MTDPEITVKLRSDEATLFIYCTREAILKDESPSTQERIRVLRARVAKEIVEFSNKQGA
jgi:hypothetical protein